MSVLYCRLCAEGFDISDITERFLAERKVFFGSRARYLYELIGWKFRNATELRFMNYGFAFEDDAAAVNLNADDEAERYCAQLYHVVASQVDLAGKAILDVGSGRGGGASHVHRYLGPARTVGCDLARRAFEFCNRVHGDVEGLEFRRGDALDLPFDNGEFDAVLNVESAHCYPDRARFFREAYRVLKPGGHFLYTDFTPSGTRPDDELRWTLAQLNQSGFASACYTDITANIVRGLEMDHERRAREIQAWLPIGTRRMASLWAGSTDSWIFKDFRDRKRTYIMYRVTKPN